MARQEKIQFAVKAQASPATRSFRLDYQPGLDGIRGISILLVLTSHGKILGDGFGFIAVNTFFVLSGFLISCLLVAEYDQTKRISFRNFYMRRALRLLPALLAMLSVFVLFAFLFDPYTRALREVGEALYALFYFTNWAAILRMGRHISLAHTWSLSVEEQFYIIWPLILFYLLRRTSRSSLLCWIFLGAFLSLITRIAVSLLGTTTISGNVFPVNPERLLGGTDTRADSLLLGCFAGVLVSSNLFPVNQRIAKAWEILATFAGFGLLALGSCWSQSSRMIYYGWFAASIFAAVLITHLVTSSHSRWNRLLGNPLLVYVGQISYGLYVWHYPILRFLQEHHLLWKNMAYLLVVLPVTLFSYYIIEKPCLRLKKRFQSANA